MVDNNHEYIKEIAETIEVYISFFKETASLDDNENLYKELLGDEQIEYVDGLLKKIRYQQEFQITKEDKEFIYKFIKFIDKNINILEKFEGYKTMSEEIKRYDDRGNLIYYKNLAGYESWREYDENDNLIYYKGLNDFEEWAIYNKQNKKINSVNYRGAEKWYEYDEKNREIHYKNSEGVERWYKYNKNNILVYHKNPNGSEIWSKYDNEFKERIKITKKEYKNLY